MQCEIISIERAERLTGLPAVLIEVLVTSNRIPGERQNDGKLYVSKMALLGWVKLYARILGHVSQRYRPVCGGHNVFEAVWMSRNGLLQ